MSPERRKTTLEQADNTRRSAKGLWALGGLVLTPDTDPELVSQRRVRRQTDDGGVHVCQHLSLAEVRKACGWKSQGQNGIWESRPYRIVGGPEET